MIALLDFQKARHVIGRPQVTMHRYPIMRPRNDKDRFLHVPLHQRRSSCWKQKTEVGTIKAQHPKRSEATCQTT
jgi:hypothetical protein